MSSQDPQTIDRLVAQLISNDPSFPQSNPAPSSPTNNPLNPQPSNLPPQGLPGVSYAQTPIKIPSFEPKQQFPQQPKPVSTSPQQTSPTRQEYQSSIRTMDSDISLIKGGQNLSGENIQKTFTITPPKPISQPLQKDLLPPAPPKEVQTPSQSKISGFTTKPGGLEGKFTIPSSDKSPIKQESKIGIAISKPNYTIFNNKQFLILGGIIVAILAGGLYWYFIWNPAPIETVPTPTPTVSVVQPVLSMFDKKFGLPNAIIVPRSENPVNYLNSIVDLPGVGKFKSYLVKDNDNKTYAFQDFMTNTGAVGASNLTTISAGEWRFVLYGHYDRNAQIVARPVIISMVDGVKAKELMASWGTNSVFINDMANLFGYKNNLYPGSVLVADQYNNVDFKYAKFPDKDYGVAYAIFLDKYLIIASSRDSFRAVLDALSSPF